MNAIIIQGINVCKSQNKGNAESQHELEECFSVLQLQPEKRSMRMGLVTMEKNENSELGFYM